MDKDFIKFVFETNFVIRLTYTGLVNESFRCGQTRV